MTSDEMGDADLDLLEEIARHGIAHPTHYDFRPTPKTLLLFVEVMRKGIAARDASSRGRLPPGGRGASLPRGERPVQVEPRLPPAAPCDSEALR